MNSGIQAVFLKLKPVCNEIINEPKIEKLKELQELIKSNPTNIIQQLHEYIIFPIFINLEKEKSKFCNSIKQEILETLKCLLSIITLSKLKVFIQLSNAVVKQICDLQTSSLMTSTDELKLISIECLQTLFKRLANSILTDLYTKNYNVHFPLYVHLCLDIAKNEKMRELRIAALNCLMTISYVHDEADFSDVVLRNQVADCVMFVFPGITIAMRDVALGDEKQGHKITALAIKALMRIVILHLTDDLYQKEDIIIEYPVKKEIKDKNIDRKTGTKVEQMMERFKTEARTKEWNKTTAIHLEKIIESLEPLQYHYHEKVRFELSDFCHQIFLHCSKNLQSSLPICTEILISLSEDDRLEVNEKSKKSLDLMCEKYIRPSFLEILSENVYNVILKLPRIINGTDVQKQLGALNLLVGYLRLLQSNLLKVLQTPNLLNRVTSSFILIAQMEKCNVSLLEEYAIRDFESISKTPLSWKNFKFLHEKSLFNKFQVALRLISQSDAAEIVLNDLCEMFANKYENRNEIIFLLNEIISVKIENFSNSSNRIDLVTYVLHMYLEEDNWNLLIDSSTLPLNKIHNNIIEMCLLVEGIGSIANCLGIQFKSFLLKTLYDVLERAGSAHPLLSAAGLLTLLKISQECQYNNVTDLIVQNADYFSFHVSKRLKRLNENIGVLNVLSVIMKYSTIEVLPSILNVVDEVLSISRDKIHERNITSFLRVFYAFIQSIKRWMNINTKEENKIVQLLLEFKKNMEVFCAMYEKIDFSDKIMGKSAQELFEEDMAKSQEFENDYDTEDDRKAELPDYIILTVAVLKKSLNFLPSKNRDRKLLTLNILKEGIEIISSFEDELLPVVHLMWSPLIDRFKEHSEPLVINKSFELLIILAKHSKDFIRSRTCKDVLPELCISLQNLSLKSYLKDRGSAYRYTQEYKLQLILLQNISQLICKLEMSDDNVNLVSAHVKPYLSVNQPLPLQESAIQFYKSTAIYDFDTVWLYLLEIFSTHETTENSEIRKNTEIILKSLEIIHW